MRKDKLKELYSAEEIAQRVGDIADRINRDYAGGSLVMICVLKGAFMFFSDLIRRVTVGPVLDFVRLASYGDNDVSSGTVHFSKDVEISVLGKDVLVVEDVVDSGITMDFLLRQLRARGANSLRIAALVDKFERREVEVHVDYAGFTLSSGFIVGYGLDHAERFRELPAVYVFDPGK
jgi:hypoxanthine phosphoribosyltransferase